MTNKPEPHVKSEIVKRLLVKQKNNSQPKDVLGTFEV